MDKIKFGIFIFALCMMTSAVVLTSGLLTTKKTVSGLGTVAIVTGGGGGGTPQSLNINLYNDSACTKPLTTIQWGQFSPGGSKTQTIYIKNTGNVPATLSLTTDTWSPTNATTYLSITWNKESTSLAVGQSVAAAITLTVDSNITGITSFSCNINIVASG